jgi:hypothetical protein
MIEQAEKNPGLQQFLNEITQNELAHFPDVQTNGEKIAFIWDNLYESLGEKDTQDDTQDAKKTKEKIREFNLARIIGVKQNQLQQSVADETINHETTQRLNRTFACTTIWMRIFEDKEEMRFNLATPQPSLHHKNPIQAFVAGNIDQVLYFAAMSGTHLNLV